MLNSQFRIYIRTPYITHLAVFTTSGSFFDTSTTCDSATIPFTPFSPVWTRSHAALSMLNRIDESEITRSRWLFNILNESLVMSYWKILIFYLGNTFLPFCKLQTRTFAFPCSTMTWCRAFFPSQPVLISRALNFCAAFSLIEITSTFAAAIARTTTFASAISCPFTITTCDTAWIPLFPNHPHWTWVGTTVFFLKLLTSRTLRDITRISAFFSIFDVSKSQVTFDLDLDGIWVDGP